MRLHELRVLTWEATLRCNLACKHCASLCGPGVDTSGELTTDEAMALFTSVAQDFSPRKVSIAITGGEPFTRKDLFHVAAHLQRLGFSWTVSTNGTLITKRVIAALRETGCSGVSVSLDGLQAHHEQLRGRGTYGRAVDAVRALRMANLPAQLEVTTCLTAPVVRDIEAVHAFVSTLGVGRWRLQPLASLGRMPAHAALVPAAAEMRRVLDWLAALRRAQSGMEVVFDEAGYLGREYERKVRQKYFFCGAGVTGAVVHAGGAVNGCVFVGPGFVQGTVRERRFSDIWNSEFRVFRDRRWTKQGLCSECREYRDCQGGCLLWRDSPRGGPCACLAMALRAGGQGNRAEGQGSRAEGKSP